MSVPGKRIQIVKLLKDRLKEIRKSNYYRTDIGNNVLEWVVTQLGSYELPAIIIRDLSAENISTASVGPYDKTRWRLNLVISVTTYGDSCVKECREAMQDVYQCIGKDDTINGNALMIQVVRDSIVVEQNEDKVCTGTIELEVLFETQTWSDQ